MKLLETACGDAVVVCGVWERRGACVCGGGVHHCFQKFWCAGYLSGAVLANKLDVGTSLEAAW